MKDIRKAIFRKLSGRMIGYDVFEFSDNSAVIITSVHTSNKRGSLSFYVDPQAMIIKTGDNEIEYDSISSIGEIVYRETRKLEILLNKLK